MADDDITYSEDEEYGKKKEVLSIKQIILKHIDRLSKYTFGGEQQPVLLDNGQVLERVDRREVVCGAIQFLSALLKPKYDAAMLEEDKKFNEAVKRLEKHLADASIWFSIELKMKTIKGTAQFRTKKSEELIKFYRSNQIIEIHKYAPYYEYFVTKKYNMYIELFTQLNYLLEREGILGAIEDYEE